MELKKSLLCLAAIASVTPTLAFADQPSYNYVDAGYLRLDLDDLSLDPTGYFLRGSVEAGENWFIQAAVVSVDDNTTFIDVEADQFDLGVGYKMPMGESSSLHIIASYIDVEAEAENMFGDKASAEEDGYGLALGVRSLVSDNFELNADLGYADLGDDDGLELSLGALWYLADNLGVLAEVGVDDDSNREYLIGLRVSF